MLSTPIQAKTCYIKQFFFTLPKAHFLFFSEAISKDKALQEKILHHHDLWAIILHLCIVKSSQMHKGYRLTAHTI